MGQLSHHMRGFCCAVLVTLAGGVTVSFVSAQTASDADMAYMVGKYQIATLADLTNEKCKRLTDTARTAVSHARERYTKDVKSAGLATDAEGYESQMKAGIRQGSCAQLLAQPMVLNAMNNVQGLLDEYMLAILRSGVSVCGGFGADKVSAVMARARDSEARLKTRADYESVNRFAQTAGQDFAEICVNPIVSDTFLIMQYPVGGVFGYAAMEVE